MEYMERRQFIKCTLAFGAGCCLFPFLPFGCSQNPVNKSRLNLLLITIDTIRADYLGYHGNPDVKTPNIDRLASSGVAFMRHIAPSQCTNPSHASILTGLYPAFHGVYDNQTRLASEAVTLAEVLNKKGFATLGAVSAHHLNPKNSNFAKGFDDFLECKPYELKAQERNKKFFKKLRSIADRAFFAWIHYFDPHGDYSPPAPFDTIYPVSSQFKPVKPLPSMNLGKEKMITLVDPDEIIPLYKGEITYLDHHIGRLMDFLFDLGIQNNTLVVLVGDHGESMTEKGIYFCHAGLYNPVTHIPLIISLPGSIPEGLEVNNLTSSVDIFPTVLNILGYDNPIKKINGRSLLPDIMNPEYRSDNFVICEAVNGVIRGIFQKEYKYIIPFTKDWAVKEAHLFRSFKDYKEEKELKYEEQKIARHMDAILKGWLDTSKSDAFLSHHRIKLDKETENALKTLGYIR